MQEQIEGQTTLDRGLDGYPEDVFDGTTYDPEKDYARLGKQMRKVWSLMRDSKWRTLSEIAMLTGSPESSVSARLRDLRKSKFGSQIVERRRVGDRGLYEYRVLTRN